MVNSHEVGKVMPAMDERKITLSELLEALREEESQKKAKVLVAEKRRNAKLKRLEVFVLSNGGEVRTGHLTDATNKYTSDNGEPYTFILVRAETPMISFVCERSSGARIEFEDGSDVLEDDPLIISWGETVEEMWQSLMEEMDDNETEVSFVKELQYQRDSSQLIL